MDEQVIDLTRPRTAPVQLNSIAVNNLAEFQRKALLIARELEQNGRPVTNRDVGAALYGEESLYNTQKAANVIHAIKKKGLWPYGSDGKNGVPTSKRLIWPNPEPVLLPSLAERQFALTVMRELQRLPEDSQLKLWPHVKQILLGTD